MFGYQYFVADHLFGHFNHIIPTSKTNRPIKVVTFYFSLPLLRLPYLLLLSAITTRTIVENSLSYTDSLTKIIFLYQERGITLLHPPSLFKIRYNPLLFWTFNFRNKSIMRTLIWSLIGIGNNNNFQLVYSKAILA